MRRFSLFIAGMISLLSVNGQQMDIRIIFTADLHFGLYREHFRNSPDSVSSIIVNRAMANAIKSLGKIDYLIVAGDIANREEAPLQSASTSWKQFMDVYGKLHIPLLVLPGNHDISNAIGHYKQMVPLKDASAAIGIYNAIHPGHHIDTTHFDYHPADFNYSRDIGGIHFIFIDIWPDSANRIWIEKDLQKVDPHTPVALFAHDPPVGDPKHFTNPSGEKINEQNKFENLLSQVYCPDYEIEFDRFLEKHPNIRIYFHGHANYQEFYTYKGINGDLSLLCDRVDSPMKGKFSSKDESLLSFQEIILHPGTKKLEIRECLWNSGKAIHFGQSYSFSM